MDQVRFTEFIPNFGILIRGRSNGHSTRNINKDERPYVDWIIASSVKTTSGFFEVHGSYEHPVLTFCRQSEFAQAEADYQNAMAMGTKLEDYQQMHHFEMKKKKLIEKQSALLRQWLYLRNSSIAQIKRENSRL